MSDEDLEELIRPAGYFRIKARRLRSLIHFLVERYDGSIEAMFRTPLGELREELLGIHGVGPETADSILLYAGSLPSFVVDAYTCRIFGRHGWIEPDADYHQVQEFFHDRLAADAAMFNEYHALLVYVGKHFCKKGKPLCQLCPLKSMLPKGGPVGIGRMTNEGE